MTELNEEQIKEMRRLMGQINGQKSANSQWGKDGKYPPGSEARKQRTAHLTDPEKARERARKRWDKERERKQNESLQ